LRDIKELAVAMVGYAPQHIFLDLCPLHTWVFACGMACIIAGLVNSISGVGIGLGGWGLKGGMGCCLAKISSLRNATAANYLG